MSLDDGRFLEYYETFQRVFKKQQITGKCIDKIRKCDLTEWGMVNFSDKSLLFEHIESLTQQNDIMYSVEGGDNTNYH